MTDTSAGVALETLATTRDSLHRVAEHVLGAARVAASGEFTLEPGAGGFRTPPLPDGRVIAVDGTDIVVITGQTQRRSPLSTVRAAAAFVGVQPGFPATTYPPATPLEPDAPLVVDPDAARVLADWYALGATALHRLATQIATDEPSPVLLFPEHFDLGVTAGQVNYGVSPGDEFVAWPYAYVGPHGGPPAGDPFWNAPFGAYRTLHEITSPDEAVSFFLLGRDRLGQTPENE